MLEVALPKIDGVSDQPAVEMNSVFNEMQNTIESTGQVLSGGDLFQTAKSIATYSAASDFYVDTGAANTYVLGAIGSLKSPAAYVDGMRIRFDATNTNTGASTVNVAGLGVKSIVLLDGTNPGAGTIEDGKYIECIYKASSGKFILTSAKNNFLFKAYQGASQIIAAEGTAVLQINTIDFPAGYTSYNTSTYRFQPDEYGYYLISGQVFFLSTISESFNPSEEELILIVRKNGSISCQENHSALNFDDGSAIANVPVLLNGTTDYIEFVASNNFAATSCTIYTGTEFTFMSAFKIG